MADPLTSFIDFMTANGCAPARASDIKPTDKWTAYQLVGDRPAQKVGKYRLKIEGDFGVGNCINHREGDCHDWRARQSGKKYTDKEKAAFKARMEEEQRVQSIERNRVQTEQAKAAKLLVDSSLFADETHAYLKRKGIKPHGARINEGRLIIPMYAEKRLWAYQTIDADGTKLFNGGIPGARQKGCYFPISSKDDSWDRILFCEGFATGASLREATGFPVMVAFNASNLEPVIESFRINHPGAQLIIAADNDQWRFLPTKAPEGISRDNYPGDALEWKVWREDGRLQNIGVEKAQQAASRVAGYIVTPDIPDDDPEKRTDFNDLHAMRGLEAVKLRVESILQHMPPPPPAPTDYMEPVRQGDISWEEFAIMKVTDKKGHHPDPSRSYNYALIAEFHPRLRGVFAWDEFHLCVMVVQCPPWVIDAKREHEFKVHALTDSDIYECDHFMQRVGMAGSVSYTESAILVAAMKNKIHPARDYFDKIKWDGVPRLDSWLITYCRAITDDPDYVRAIGRTWMIAAVKRVYEPGCKFDHMLILEGGQGVGKSTALRVLSTFGAESYFSDTFNLRYCTDKDELAKLRGVMIVEIPELAGFSKADRDDLTKFITTVQDEYRLPYSRTNQKYPRQFVLAGSYNPVDGLFTDPTGFRRFWCVAVGNRVLLDDLARDREQLWAESVHRYKAGETLELSPELYKKAEEANETRRIIDDWTMDVLEYCRGKQEIEVRHIMNDLGIDKRHMGRRESNRVCAVLKAEGFQRIRKRRGTQQVYVWAPPADFYTREQTAPVGKQTAFPEMENIYLEDEQPPEEEEIPF